jgi:MobL relaxases
MRVVFHIISTGGGSGGSRATRYISEREKDPEREGPGARPLFSQDREGLTYRKADRILDPVNGEPAKDDLIHVSVSLEEEDFEKLGKDEKERQARLREVVREGMKGMAAELNVYELTWVAGIHRNSDNPHAHIVMRNSAMERGGVKEKQIGPLRKSLLPHKEMQDGKELIVPGRIGEKFVAALDKQQALYLNPNSEQVRAQEALQQLIDRMEPTNRANQNLRLVGDTHERSSGRARDYGHLLDSRAITISWNTEAKLTEDDNRAYRIALGRHLEFNTRLAFAEIWHERAVKHGDTYRFNVVDQTTDDERKISELDVHRRADARAKRIGSRDHGVREQAYEADLSRHRETLDQLSEARESKIAALGKDVCSLRGTLSKVEQGLAGRQTPSGKSLTPLISRQTLSELENTAIRLNLTEKVTELEKLRTALAREHKAPTRTDDEAARLVAQVNVARADFMARSERLDNFDASVHLTKYEVHGERWSLSALDKRIARRQEDSKLIPERAARLDLRSLARINYSPADREQAANEVIHLSFIRGEVVRQIEQRRQPLIADRELSGEMVEILEKAFSTEQRARVKDGREMPGARYEHHQMNSLESSAEILRDVTLLREVHEWEKSASRSDGTVSWEGRAVAREIMSGLAAEEAKGRLHHFLESRRVASLNLGHYRTATLREVEARTLTEYLARAIESSQHRDHRHSITDAAREHHGRLVNDFQKARNYHDGARELASEAQGREPKFTDKEKINLEIYADRQNDENTRQQYFDLAKTEPAHDREIAVSLSR